MTPTVSAPYYLLHVDAWDHALGEARTGGRTLEVCYTLAEALRALSCWAMVAERAYGPGVLVITDRHGDLVDLDEPEGAVCPFDLLDLAG